MTRYSRQIRFPGIGEGGQERLGRATVAIVGLGATGSAIFNALLRAGVGSLRIVDRDWVEEHNLPRQTLYTEADAAALIPKAVAAAAHARAINSAAAVTPLVADVNAETIDRSLAGADLVLDGADNLELRYLINEWCVRAGRPWIYTGVLAAHGMTMTFQPGGPCFQCVFPAAPPPGSVATCETAGVVGPVVGVLGNLAALEAVKLLAGSGAPNPGILAVDGWNWSFDQFPAPLRHPECPVCAHGRYERLEGDSGRAASLCGRDAVQIRPGGSARIDLAALEDRLRLADVATVRTEHLLRFAVEAYRLTVFPDGRAIISGTDDEAQARGVYARWIGN